MMCIKVVLIAAFFVIVYKLLSKRTSLIPGPWNLPFVGYLPWIDFKKPWFTLANLAKTYGSIYFLKLGAKPAVVISDVKLAKKIFSKDEGIAAAPLYFRNHVFGTNGVVFADGKLWQENRTLVAKFLRNIIVSKDLDLQGLITQEVTALAGDIERMGDSVLIEPSHLIFEHIASLMSFLMLGKRLTNADGRLKKLVGILDGLPALLERPIKMDYIPMLRFVPQFRATATSAAASVQTLCSIIKEVIHADPLDNYASLGQAIHGKKYSDQRVDNLLSDMVLASIETTTNTLLFYLGYMASYPDVQEKVRRELKAIDSPTYNNLKNLPFFNAVFCEVLRIAPTVSAKIQSAFDDIEINGYVIRKETMLVCIIENIHKDSKVWGDPDTFRPERFIDTDGKLCKPDALIPFGIGKRICLGKDLVKQIMFVTCAVLLQKFEIKGKSKQMDLIGVDRIVRKFKPQDFIFTRLTC